MTLWRKRLTRAAIMVQRRFGNVAFKIIRTPPQLIALIFTLVLLCALWADLLINGTSKDPINFVKYHDKNRSALYYRPVLRKDPKWEETKKEGENNDCPIYQFKSSGLSVAVNDTIPSPVTCKRLPPVPGSCDVAKDIFDLHSAPNPSTCSHQEEFNFCNLQRTESNAWIVKCDYNATEVCTSSLNVGLPSHETGELVWKTYQNITAIGQMLTHLIQDHDSLHIPPHYGFAFIGCYKKQKNDDQINENYYYYEHYTTTEDSYAEQLLILPPTIRRPSKSKIHTHSSFHYLNLNVILVDSVSHQHLFRSLPKTVSMLEHVSSQNVAEVFNFELLQAIKSRTFETLQTIFSGYINFTENPFGRYDVPPKPLNLAPIYKPLQNRGYRTLWLEDLCYLWEWGISKDLRFLKLDSSAEETWKRMWLTLIENGVDSIDATISMCRLLKANKVKDHFHGPEAVCFNGKHQHEYILEYLKLYQTEMITHKQPFFTMTSTNVGHEQTGQRVQTLDDALSNYISFTPQLENTISIIFSDHGNSYGEYFQTSNEAEVELYHPFMFFIIPKSAFTLLGIEMMDSLRLNTKRLITALDIHYTLLHITNINSKGRSQSPDQQFSVSEKGLFEPVDPERDCYSIPRLKPNVCICQSLSITFEVSSFASLFGYLAIGALNDEIQFLYRQSLEASSAITAFGHCEPLYIEKVTDIKEIAGAHGKRFFQMNIHVQQAQVFFISVTLTKDKHGNSKSYLESYSRNTPYGIYSNCSDPDFDLALCICNLSVSEIQKESHHLHNQKHIPPLNAFQKSSFMTTLPFFEHVITPLKDTPCLYIFKIRHKDGEAIYSTNECKTIYTLKMNVKSVDSKFVYFYKEEESLLLPGGVAFLGLVLSEVGEMWKNSVLINFTLKKH